MSVYPYLRTRLSKDKRISVLFMYQTRLIVMETLTTLTKPTLLATGIALGLGTSSALAADFRSTYTFADTTTPTVNTVILNFSTDVTSGVIDESDLTAWSIELLNGTTSVYLDNVIVGGVVQPIGGVSRALSEINFDFNLDTLQYTGLFDNDVSLVQNGAATGVTYDVLGSQTGLAWDRFVDGSFDGAGSTGGGLPSVVLTTEEVTTPEPSILLGLLVVGSLGTLTRKRKSIMNSKA
ncbi:MAG: PEP-CTERM sorting domain-containing protein [Crocosphaera sp.]